MLNVILQGSHKQTQQIVSWDVFHYKTQLLKLLNVFNN
jgi:hypothetical protein